MDPRKPVRLFIFLAATDAKTDTIFTAALNISRRSSTSTSFYISNYKRAFLCVCLWDDVQHTKAPFLSLSLSLSLSFTLTLSLTHSLSLLHTHPYKHTHTHTESVRYVLVVYCMYTHNNIPVVAFISFTLECLACVCVCVCLWERERVNEWVQNVMAVFRLSQSW